MRGYRYSTEEFTALAARGRFRLRPLSYYRDLEKSGSLIPDELEGGVSYGTGEKPIHVGGGLEDKDLKERLRRIGINIEGESSIESLHVSNVKTFIRGAYMVLCFSSILGERNLIRDAGGHVLECTSVGSVGRLLHEAHSSVLGKPTARHVRYERRSFDLLKEGHATPSPFVKAPEFASQQETRIIWPLLDRSLQYFDTDAPACAEFLRAL